MTARPMPACQATPRCCDCSLPAALSQLLAHMNGWGIFTALAAPTTLAAAAMASSTARLSVISGGYGTCKEDG